MSELRPVAIVTGASGGIGEAVVRRLAADGVTLVLADLDIARAQVVARELDEETLVVEVDVADEHQVDRLFARALDRFGAIHMVHNNAGIEGGVAPITAVSKDDFDRVMRVNVVGAFLGCRAALRHMQSSARPVTVLNTASATALRGVFGSCAYSTSKHAVLGITRCAALEAARHGGRVNAICPGVTETRMMRALERGMAPDDPSGAKAMITQAIPAGRYGLPEEAGALAAWLLSPRSAFANGAIFSSDGGYTAG